MMYVLQFLICCIEIKVQLISYFVPYVSILISLGVCIIPGYFTEPRREDLYVMCGHNHLSFNKIFLTNFLWEINEISTTQVRISSTLLSFSLVSLSDGHGNGSNMRNCSPRVVIVGCLL